MRDKLWCQITKCLMSLVTIYQWTFLFRGHFFQFQGCPQKEVQHKIKLSSQQKDLDRVLIVEQNLSVMQSLYKVNSMGIFCVCLDEKHFKVEMHNVLINPFNSKIIFVILLTVNHTILMMLVQKIQYGSTNYPQIDIFLFILITYLVDIVLML